MVVREAHKCGRGRGMTQEFRYLDKEAEFLASWFLSECGSLCLEKVIGFRSISQQLED